MKYFAYGSNLKLEDLNDWCRRKNVPNPKLTNPQPFKLENYKLGFTRKSINRKGGVADIIFSTGDFCWGVNFDVDKQDLSILDMKEGVSSGAYKQFPLSDNVITYVVVNKANFVQPHPDYVDLIIQGARKYNLPQTWIDKLESFKIQF